MANTVKQTVSFASHSGLKSVLIFFIVNTFLFLTPNCIWAQEKKLHNELLPLESDRGARYVTGSIGEPSNLVPYISTDSASSEVTSLIFVSLLRYNKDLHIEPFAAEHYSVEDEGKLLRFRLRKGIMWEDGVELTTDDIEFTWKIVTDPKTASPYAESFMSIKEFRKIDKYNFEVTYDRYYAKSLISWMGAILPKHILQGQNLRNTSFSRKPIGAGPFRLDSWVPGSSVTLKSSPSYFEGEPYINTVIFRIIPDLATMFLETKSGNLDMMGLTPQQYLRQTSGKFWEENYCKYKYLSSAYVYMGFNMMHPFFKDVMVRKAISHAIDRQAIVKGVLMGQGVAAFGPYKPGSWAYHPSLKPPKFDIDLAKSLLQKAGFEDKNKDGIVEKDGKDFVFTLLTNQGNEQRILTATVIQSQLKALGIKVEIRTIEWAAFIKEFINKGQFDAVILGWTITQDPDIFDVWHSSKAKPGGLNFTRYTNEKLDELLIEARQTPDIKVRTALYAQVQEILDEEQPYNFLYVPYALPVVQSRFHGIKPELAGIMYNFDKWWVPKRLQRSKLTP